MVWQTIGSKTAKEQNGTCRYGCVPQTNSHTDRPRRNGNNVPHLCTVCIRQPHLNNVVAGVLCHESIHHDGRVERVDESWDSVAGLVVSRPVCVVVVQENASGRRRGHQNLTVIRRS